MPHAGQTAPAPTRKYQKIVRLLIIPACIGLSMAATAAAAHARPSFVETPCFLDDCSVADGDPGITFGWVSVPENRARPDGRKLRLGVAILRARAKASKPDPIVYLAGGPGVSALFSIKYFASHYLRKDRDIILFDARGVGHSEPKLCPDLGEQFMALLASGQSPEDESRAKLAHYARCLDTLRQDGTDLGAYSSLAIARDVADIRVALGYQQWNLYGISYGTRYAQTIMRDAPHGVRSVILDSVVPMGKFHVTATTRNYQRGLQAYFSACARHSACATANPDLHARFLQIGRDLAANPLTVTLAPDSGVPGDRFVVDFQDLHLAVQQILYDNDFYPVLPLLIDVFDRRDTVALARLLPALSRGLYRYSFAHAILVNRYDNGMYLDQPMTHDPELARGLAYLEADVEALRAWPSAIGDEREVTPVRSDLPTLVLAGGIDPITPPAYSEYAAGFLSRAHYAYFPTIGHGVSRSGPCPQAVVESFIDNPDSAPDTACIAAMGPIDFITDIHRNSHVAGLGIALFQDNRPAVLIPLLLCVLLLISALPVGVWSLVMHLRDRQSSTPARPAASTPARAARGARALMVLGALLALCFVAGLLYFMAVTAGQNTYLLLFGLVGSAGALFVLPYVLCVMALASSVLALLSWRQGWWSVAARVHHSLVAGAQLGVLALIAAYQLW